MSIEILILWLLASLAGVFFVATGKLAFKKKIAAILLLVVFGASGALLYAEYRFGVSQSVKCDISAEEILAAMPSITISEEDISMMKELLESEEIAEGFLLAEEGDGSYRFPQDVSENLLMDWIPEGFDVRYLSASVRYGKSNVNIIFISDLKQWIEYSFDSDFDSLRKTIRVYGKTIYGKDITTIYTNLNNDVITKWEEKRLWFGWLTNKLAVSE